MFWSNATFPKYVVILHYRNVFFVISLVMSFLVLLQSIPCGHWITLHHEIMCFNLDLPVFQFFFELQI